jgi:hypothetical protein
VSYSDEVRQKAALLVEFYQAVVNGERLEFQAVDKYWHDTGETTLKRGPDLGSDLRLWRVKPKPLRKMWTTENHGETYCEERAAEWKRHGIPMIEWQEVRHE